jgi:hypothetical protein
MLKTGSLMKVTFEIPDDIAAALSTDGRNLSRAALEALAVEGHRTEQLSEGQIAQMLGFDGHLQVHGFLKEHQAYMHYTYEDFLGDYEVAKRVADEAAKNRS